MKSRLYWPSCNPGYLSAIYLVNLNFLVAGKQKSLKRDNLAKYSLCNNNIEGIPSVTIAPYGMTKTCLVGKFLFLSNFIIIF